jgi:hypothetical protein
MDLKRISDELEITALHNSYARAVDTKDWCFSFIRPDAITDVELWELVSRDVNLKWLRRDGSKWPRRRPGPGEGAIC